jgi:hypothetical protein
MPLKCSTLGKAFGLGHKQNCLERLNRDEHTSLICTLVSYGRKKYYKIGSFKKANVPVSIWLRVLKYFIFVDLVQE